MKQNSLITKIQIPNKPCIHPWFYLWINAAGDATVCPQNKIRLGSLDKYSIEDLWNNEVIHDIRLNFLNGNYEQAGCERECPYLRGVFSHANTAIPIGELIFPDIKIDDLEIDSKQYKNINIAIDGYSEGLVQVLNNPVVFDCQNILTCNADCIMCGQPHGSKLKHSSNVTKKIIEASSEYLCTIRWQGGEVFLDKDFISNVLTINQNSNSNLAQIIITNGSLLNNEKISELLNTNGKINFIVSMDGASKEIVDKIRHKLKYEKIMETIIELSNIQKSLGRLDLILWNYTVMNSNISEVYSAIKLADKLGVNINLAAIQGNFPRENIFEFKLIENVEWIKYLENWEYLISQVAVNVSGLDGLKSRYKYEVKK